VRKVFTMPKKDQQYTTMTDEVRLALVRYKKYHPGATQKELIKWLEDTHQLKVSQAMVSRTLKRSAELLAKAATSNLSSKRQKMVKFLVMEAVLAEWFLANQEHVNLSGDLICESATNILDRLYPNHPSFEFSNGWLEASRDQEASQVRGKRFNRHGYCCSCPSRNSLSS
jgi:hypothetical protein